MSDNRTAQERFDALSQPEPMTGCTLWLGATASRGHGHFRFHGKLRLAHRWAYERSVGPVPDGLVLDHVCDTPACVNPEHLRPSTQRANIIRGNAPTAVNARKTHCIRGHVLADANLTVMGGKQAGGRRCRQCKRDGSRRRYAEAKA